VEENAKGDVQKTLASWITYFLAQQTACGIMLEAKDHEYLAGLRDGKKFSKSRELVAMVEKAMRREDSQYTQQVPIDPAWIKPLEEQSGYMGLTPEQLLTDLINTVMSNGWAYSWTPAHQLNFTEGDFEQLRAFMGTKQFFGSDLAKKLRGEVQAPAEAEKVAA
jgi:hypothetical protein